jgi:hypothetical protein
MLSDSNYLSQSDIENDIDENTKIEINKASKISPAPISNNIETLNNENSNSKDKNSETNDGSESDETRAASQISD